MDKINFKLIEEIMEFLQENYFPRLVNLLEDLKENQNPNISLISKYKKRSFRQHWDEVSSQLNFCGTANSLMGKNSESDRKLEEKENILKNFSQKILEEENKNLIQEDREFLKILKKTCQEIS